MHMIYRIIWTIACIRTIIPMLWKASDKRVTKYEKTIRIGR